VAKATEAPAPAPAADTAEASIVARLGAQKQKFKAAARALTSERDSLREENARIKAENEDLKKKADTSASSKRVAELEQQLRERDHRAAFDRVAKARGVREEALSDAWQLSGYRAEGEPDDDAIGALIDEQRAARGYLFAEPDKAAETKPPVKPGVGSGQGAKPAGAPQVLGQDDPRMSDVRWQMMNFDRISSAAMERMQRGEI
jgi:hypothetical protein